MYTVMYRETDRTTLADHDAIAALPTENVGLLDIIDMCATYHTNAALYDGAGWSKGWVHADGNYRLT